MDLWGGSLPALNPPICTFWCTLPLSSSLWSMFLCTDQHNRKSAKNTPSKYRFFIFFPRFHISLSRWPAGGAANTMEASSDEEVQEAAMQVLRNIYGSAAKEPVACAVSRWGGDPYSRGQIPCCPSCHLLQQRFNQSCDSKICF